MLDDTEGQIDAFVAIGDRRHHEALAALAAVIARGRAHRIRVPAGAGTLAVSCWRCWTTARRRQQMASYLSTPMSFAAATAVARISSTASNAEIKAAYRQLVHHPDAGGDDQQMLALNGLGSAGGCRAPQGL